MDETGRPCGVHRRPRAAGTSGSTYRMRPGGSGSTYVTPLASGKWNTAPFGGFVSALQRRLSLRHCALVHEGANRRNPGLEAR